MAWRGGEGGSLDKGQGAVEETFWWLVEMGRIRHFSKENTKWVEEGIKVAGGRALQKDIHEKGTTPQREKKNPLRGNNKPITVPLAHNDLGICLSLFSWWISFEFESMKVFGNTNNTTMNCRHYLLCYCRNLFVATWVWLIHCSSKSLYQIKCPCNRLSCCSTPFI